MVNTVSITRIRTLGILVAIWLGLGLMLSESFAQQIGLFYHSDYIQIDEGNIFAEGSNLYASISMLGYNMNLINEFTAANIIESDLLIIPELERKNLFLDLNSKQQEDLKNFVGNGGGLIISGVVAPNEANAQNATDLLNGIFNFSLQTSEVALTGHSLKDSQGDQYGFSDSPDKIPNNNSVAFITSGLPVSSVSIYSDINNSDFSSVSILEYGKGKIIYLGWGWWNALPSGTQDGGWMSILETAINIASCPHPELSASGSKPSFNLEANKEVSIEAVNLPLLINTCTDEYDLRLSKSVFDCDDIGNNEITITLEDKIGRIVKETILIEIKDQNDFCRSVPSFINLQGRVTTSFGEPVGAVKVNLKGENSFKTNSDIHGKFQISDIPTADRYNLQTTKDTKHLNGVSTYDLVLLSKHINGVINFSSPYQYIAADVNNSGTITIRDLLELRNLILFQTTRFENHNSWQIINNSVDLSDPLSPDIDVEEVFEAGAIMNRFEYTGVKIGDINASANPRRRNNDEGKILIEDSFVRAGENIRIPISFENSQNIEGFQLAFEIEDENLQVKDLSSNLQNFDKSNFNNTDEGLFLSWVSYSTHSINKDVEIYIDVKVKKDTYLSESVGVLNREFNSELYNTDLEIIDLKLHYTKESQEIEQEISLNSKVYNHPNPFVDFTEIYFDLLKKSEVRLEVHSNNGTLILSNTATYEKGTQKIRLDATQIINPGLYYYSIIQGDLQKTTNALIKF